eukprot:jgi/Astpho2/3163/Aster-x1128
MASKGYNITQQDMDASRLVFVSVKNAKPRRKVAVPVPDGFTWAQFLLQVQKKLKLAAVDSVFLASSGERIHSLDDLQDIDELHVLEGSTQPVSAAAFASSHPPGNGNGDAAGPSLGAPLPQANGLTPPFSDGGSGLQRSLSEYKHKAQAADIEVAATAAGQAEEDQDQGQKYVKRTSSVTRAVQRALPSLFQPRLPVTSRY